MKVAVVGGGLGGLLVAAELLRRGAHPTVFEASDRVGGVAATRREDGFTFEPGAGSFPLPHPVLSQLVGNAGIETRPRPGSSRRYVSDGGEFVPLGPSPVGLGRAALRLVGPKGVLAALGEPLRRPAPVDEESLEAFLARRMGPAGRLGAELIATGVHAGDPAALEAAAVVPGLVAGEAAHGSLLKAGRLARRTGAPRPVQHLVEGGMQAFADAVAGHVGDVRVGVGVDAMEPDGDGWSVLDERFDQVVLAIGPDPASRLLGLGAPDPWESAPVAVVGLGGVDDRMSAPDGFGGLVLGSAGMATLGVLFEGAPAGSRYLKVLVGGSRHPDVVDLADEDIVELVVGEVARLTGGVVEPSFVAVARRHIPQHVPGHLARVGEFESTLPVGISVAGWWYRGIGVGSLATDAGRLVDRLVG